MKRYVSCFLTILILSLLPTTISVRAAVPALPGLSVSGTEIMANGQPVQLRGVNMGDPFWARNPAWYPNYSLADYSTVSQDWRANVVRISIFPTQWKNMDRTTLLNGLSQQINAALDNKLYVIISYHVIGWPDGFYQQAYPGNPADTYDSSMSVATSFWSAMAQIYGSDTRIIFDLWNEPVHPDDFTLHGSDPNPLWLTLKGYYESLIQTVRNNGGQNIVIATGNRWASWLVGIKDNPLTDPNVVYAYHKYSVNGSNTLTEWDKDTGGLIGVKPVIVSEWGYEDIDAGANPTWPGSQASYGDPFTQWMESHNLSNLAWMYHNDWTPALLRSNGSPTLYGAFVKNYISSSSLAPLDPARISFQEIASGLTNPIFITNAGDGSGRIFIVERLGRIRIRKNKTLLATPFLDIQSLVKSTSGEQGLLALAFDPAYAINGNFYVAYTAPRNGDATGSNLVLEKFSVSANNPDLVNPNSGVVILTINHPVNSNHNGGTLAFGQDGYLYWSTGDGGSGGDPPNNAQQLNSLLGKILRMDVHSGTPYGIPTSNPFYSSVDPSVKKEIWAYGLRNPWRLSFDRSTHDLYIGDVGQSTREEVDFQSAASLGGENYGWKIMEGSICYNAATCDQSNKVLPVAEYTHTLGCSITGGYVYRGSNSPSFYGYYLYGDYCSGRFFSLYKDPALGWKSVQLLDTPYSISTFGEDEQGELYLADYATGKLYKVSYQESFIITGKAGVAGATMSYTDGAIKTVTADGSGNYSITVPYGWTGTVIPGKACYTFNPPNQGYSNVITNQTALDYTATHNANMTYTLTGNTSLPGVTLSYVDGILKTVISDNSGNYSITVPCTWTGTLTPSLTGYLFAPAIRNYSNLTTNQTAQNYNLYTVSPADFNGDGKTDVAVFRPSNSTWYISGQSPVVFGTAGDIPVPADYNGDGKDDIAVFRPSNSTWYINGQGSFVYGTVGDIPVVADYNGDGKDDIAVFRQSNSTWYIVGQGSFSYGASGDIPVVADYNGDGKADIAVFRPTNSTWYLYGIGPRVFGTVGDVPVVADYNGDGKADVAVFRPTNSTWYLYGVGPSVYGTVGDIPVIGDYNGDGKADITVFRPSNSTWYKYGVGPSVFGTVGDIPV